MWPGLLKTILNFMFETGNLWCPAWPYKQQRHTLLGEPLYIGQLSTYIFTLTDSLTFTFSPSLAVMVTLSKVQSLANSIVPAALPSIFTLLRWKPISG